MNTYTSRTHHISCHWESVLARLKTFDALAQQQKKTDVLETHAELVSATSTAMRRDGSASMCSEAVDAAFIEGVWLSLERYPALVHHPEIENLDTAGSQIFCRFAPDAPATPAEREKLKHRLQQVFALDATAMEALTWRLASRTAPLAYRHQIMQGLETRFNLVSDAPDLDAAVWHFFQRLFPDAPFQAGDVKLVKTASALYFCLPTVASAKKNGLPAASRQFLQKIWEVEPFAHFPVFSTFDAEKVDFAVRQQLAEHAGLSVELTTLLLTRMIGFLPLDELDQFLIHDTWGHQWQECLLDFEEPYRQLAKFHRPLSLTEEASVLGEHTTLAAAFITTDSGEVRLNRRKLHDFIDAEFYERSIVAFTPILAELLADAVEYKFLMLHPEQAHLLPSSSLLKDFPSKLDLTLADLRKCFAHAAEVFQKWITCEEAQHTLRQELTRRLQKPVAAEMIEETVQCCKARLEQHYQPEWRWAKTAEGHLQLNAFSLAALNFLRIHTALLHAYETLARMETEHAFSDTLVLAMGTFFLKAPQKHLWELDRFVMEGFLPRWEQCFA